MVIELSYFGHGTSEHRTTETRDTEYRLAEKVMISWSHLMK
jgi:hypothetical protein